MYEFGLLDMLRPLGKPHIIGSCRMDMMAWNDLDIDIENDGMDLDKLYQLTAGILKVFHPTWYEAKEEHTPEGKTVWFHGFEFVLNGELWNVDLWFFDQKTIQSAEAYCDSIARTTSAAQKEQIVLIKQGLIKRELYSFDKFHSMDVYRAVLDMDIHTIDEFLERYPK